MRPAARWHQNLGLKLLSIALALLLWFYVHGIKVVERELVLPLRCTNLPDSLTLLADPPHEARVLVSAQAQELLFRRFVPGAELRLDLARARPPLVRLVPTVADVELGSKERLSLLRVMEPGAFELPVDRRVQRLLPVRVMLEGELPSGCVLQGTPRPSPAEVRCTGGASRLAGLREVPTRRLDLNGRRASFDERVGLDPGRDRVVCEPALVAVQVTVIRVKRRALTGRPLTILSPPGGDWVVDAKPAVATLTLSGPQAEIDGLKPDDVAVVLDLRDLSPGLTSRVPLVPRVPAWARVDSLEPAAVDVTIRRRGRHH